MLRLKKCEKGGSNAYLGFNIAIYYTDGTLPAHAIALIKQYLKQSIPAISVITELGLLGFEEIDEEKARKMTDFIDRVKIIEIDDAIKKETIDIRKKVRIKLPDAIIAATAKVNGLVLISRNEKDFKNITGLKFVNPFH